MLKYILQYSAMFLIALTIISQVIIPAVLGQELFWLFKKKKPTVEEDLSISSLDELKQETKQTVNQYNKTKKKITSEKQGN